MKIADFIDAIKQHKMGWVESTEKGDMPPTIFAYRDGLLCTITANQIDKDYAFWAARICRTMLDVEFIVVALDSHMYELEEGETEEEYRKKFPPGSMQKMCDEEGACELGVITDCLACHVFDTTGEIDGTSLPYDYHGKGTTFKWKELSPRIQEGIQEAGENVQFSGIVPETLKAIMAMPPFLREKMKQLGKSKKFQLGDEEIEARLDRATYSILAAQGFMVLGRVSKLIADEGDVLGTQVPKEPEHANQ